MGQKAGEWDHCGRFAADDPKSDRLPSKVCSFVLYDGARHGFAVRTHPGYSEEAAKPGFEEAKRFLARYLPVPG